MTKIKKQHHFTFPADLSLPFYVENKEIEEKFCNTWESAKNVLKECEFDFGTGKILFHADWSEVAESVITSMHENRLFYTQTDENERNRIIKYMDKHKHKSPTLKIDIKTKTDTRYQNTNIIRMYLMNVFLALNITSPGCAEFYNVTPTSDYNYKVSLSSFHMYDAWKFSWPTVEQIDFTETISWIADLNIGRRQVAETPIERVLFSILRVCDGNFPGPPHLVWLSHALEAIIDTPSERISSALRDRLFLILGTPPNTKKAKKLITNFYNLRSRVVHGDFRILHPLENEILDEEVESYHDEFREPISFAIALLISIAQKFIKNGWSSLEYIEALAPEKLK